MNLKILLLAWVGALVASEVPVRAQDRTKATETEIKSSISSIRVAAAPNGFQLVEHGPWPSSEGWVASGTNAGNAEPSSAQGDHRPTAGTGPLTFRRASYLPHVYAAEVRYGLPKGLLDALVWTESRYNPLAVSHVGAVGLGQLMPATAREVGVTNRFDPVSNIDGAARYLRQMLDRFRVVHLALAAYNAGPGAVTKAGGIPRNGETPAYVRSVLRRWKQ